MLKIYRCSAGNWVHATWRLGAGPVLLALQRLIIKWIGGLARMSIPSLGMSILLW